MKIKIGNYPSRWTSRIYTNYMNDKYGYVDWPTYKQKGLAHPPTQPFAEFWREKIEDALQWLYNNTINRILDRRVQKVKIHIDRWDTWSMDHTLAYIILPMLKQLKATKHGAPMVDMGDVPEHLRVNDVKSKAYWDTGETDDKFFERWDWVMDEMIWAFEQKCRDDWESDYQIEEGELGEPIEVDIDGEILHEMNWVKEPVWDWDGRKAHQERMSNGFKLFGKYYEALWD